MSNILDIYLFSKPQWMRSVYLYDSQKHFIADFTEIFNKNHASDKCLDCY